MSISSIVSQGVSFLKTNVIPVVKAERQKITLVALSIFSLMAAYAVVCCFRIKKITDAQGSILEGRFIIMGKLWGKGSITRDSLKEEGNFRNNKLHGQGKVTHNGRIIEEGQYEHGVLKRGSRTRLTGTLLQGNFNQDGKLMGEGTIRHANGDKENGEFEGGKLIKGEQKYDYGTREIGTFVDGQLDGPNGMQIFSGGTVFKGTFSKGDLREGERRFVETRSDGTQVIRIQSGSFKDGAPVGPSFATREVPYTEETLLLDVIP